jgi:hypothetical protein
MNFSLHSDEFHVILLGCISDPYFSREQVSVADMFCPSQRCNCPLGNMSGHKNSTLRISYLGDEVLNFFGSIRSNEIRVKIQLFGRICLQLAIEFLKPEYFARMLFSLSYPGGFLEKPRIARIIHILTMVAIISLLIFNFRHGL